MTEAYPPDDLHPRIDHFWTNLRRRTAGLETEPEVGVTLDEVLHAYFNEHPVDKDKQNSAIQFFQAKAINNELRVFKAQWDELEK